MGAHSWSDGDGGDQLLPGSRVALRSNPERHGSVALILRELDREHYLVQWDDGDVGDLLGSALIRE